MGGHTGQAAGWVMSSLPYYAAYSRVFAIDILRAALGLDYGDFGTYPGYQGKTEADVVPSKMEWFAYINYGMRWSIGGLAGMITDAVENSVTRDNLLLSITPNLYEDFQEWVDVSDAP